MAKASKDFPSRVQKALGAERVISLEDLPTQGPLDLIQLAAELKSRLQSSGGRPSDPDGFSSHYPTQERALVAAQ